MRKLTAVNSGHAEIGDDGVKWFGAGQCRNEHVNSCLSPAGTRNSMAIEFKHCPHRVQNAQFVVDDENTQATDTPYTKQCTTSSEG